MCLTGLSRIHISKQQFVEAKALLDTAESNVKSKLGEAHSQYSTVLSAFATLYASMSIVVFIF